MILTLAGKIPMSRVEDDRHKAKMAKRKAAQDAEVAAKPILEKGLLIVHTGPGKGKSTAAFGLALPCPAAWPYRVGVVEFIKGLVDRRAHGGRALRNPSRVANDGPGLHFRRRRIARAMSPLRAPHGRRPNA